MKTKEIVRDWSLLQKTFLEVFESCMKWPISCTELLAQRKAVQNKERLCFLVDVLLTTAATFTGFYVVSMVESSTFGYSLKAVVYLLCILLAIGGIFIFIRNSSRNLRQGLDQDSLQLWDDVSGLFHEIYKHRQILDTFSSSELIAYLDDEVRNTVKEILRLQNARRSPMDDSDKHLKVYLKNLVALVVRLGLMNTHKIRVGMCNSEETLYNDRADRFYGILFVQPDFVIS